MTDLLLIHLPLPGMVRVPHGLLSIATYLKAHGWTCRILDLRLGLTPKLLVGQAIRNTRRGAVGFSVMTAQIPAFLQFVGEFRDQLRDKTVVVGGIHPALFPGQFDRHVDIAVDIAGEPWARNHFGIAEAFDYRNYRPDYTALPGFDTYVGAGHSHFGPLSGPGHISIETSRGCSGRCAFCINRALPWGHPVRRRDPNMVFDELFSLKARGVRTVTLNDEHFLGDVVHARAVGYFLGVNGFRWGASARVWDILKHRITIKGLAERRGLRCLNVGIEAGTDAALKLLHKPHTVDQAREAAAVLNDAGIYVVYSYIEGIPGTDAATDAATRRLAAEIARIHPYSRTSPPGGRGQPYRPYPGTELAAGYEFPDSLEGWRFWLQTTDAKVIQY